MTVALTVLDRQQPLSFEPDGGQLPQEVPVATFPIGQPANAVTVFGPVPSQLNNALKHL